MFSHNKHLYFCVILYIFISQSCSAELPLPPSLVLYSPGDPEYTDVLVKRVHDNLTLVCELRGDTSLRSYVWNYVGSNGTMHVGDRPLLTTPVGPASNSTLEKTDLQLTDSGQYMCSVPPFSVTKYIVVQNKTEGPVQCARGAFSCGDRCVLLAYVCDGRRDCKRGEDEAVPMCDRDVCSRPYKLNCSSGRCISSSACCRGATPLCQQPSCCNEFTSRGQLDANYGYVEAEFPPLFEDRHAPDDYGFIQSTIYTVTACALIFMIAVVLLVSAICKMQMKRAALRGYTHADRDTRTHYSAHYLQAHRFPPCYEASLLEQEGRALSPPRSPSHELPAQHDQISANVSEPRGLARLSAIFSSRYRQVPTHPDVELSSIPPTARPSPTHAPLLDYRSPTYCDLESEFVFASPDSPQLGRDLNYEVLGSDRRNVRRNTLERVMEQLDRQRLTLQLGRFQLSIPRLRSGGRADTPVAGAAETYTLNGRTIRLLGAELQPPAPPPPPPPYCALRYKLYGPPPEYLSREALNRRSADSVDEQAASNVEMPPRYDDLAAGDVGRGNNDFGGGNNDFDGGNNDFGGGNCGFGGRNSVGRENNEVGDGNNDVGSGNNDVGSGNGVGCGNVDASNGNSDIGGGNGAIASGNSAVGGENADVTNGNSDVINGNNESNKLDVASAVSNSDNANGNGSSTVTETVPSNVETFNSIIDNLPAIDSDVNANDAETVAGNDNVASNVTNSTVVHV